jgi:hypothetical protein
MPMKVIGSPKKYQPTTYPITSRSPVRTKKRSVIFAYIDAVIQFSTPCAGVKAFPEIIPKS